MNKELDIELRDYEKEATAKEKAKPYIQKFEKARIFASQRDFQLQQNICFYEGNPYLLQEYNDERPWVVQMNTPYASMAIDTRTASLAASDYIGELQPFTPEDVETVKALQRIYETEWNRAKINLLIDQCITKAAVVREAYVHLRLDTKKKIGGRPGEITAEIIDTTAILLDPSARDYKDAHYIIILGRITKNAAAKAYPALSGLMKEIHQSGNPDERGEKYLDNDYTTSQEDVLAVKTFYTKDGEDITRIVLIEDVLVEEQELKALKRFPIAQLRWKKASQSAYGIGLMDDLLPLQKAITSIESAITNTAVAYASPAMLIRKGSGIDPQQLSISNGAPGVVYVTNLPLQDTMQPVVPPKIDDKIVSLKNNFESAIDKIAGVTNPFIGSIGTAGNTAQGSQLAVERAKIIETSVLTNIAEFVEHLTLVFIDYIKGTYAGKKVTSRKRNKDMTTGSYEFEEIDIPKNVSGVDFNFFIDLNTKTPYSKQKELDLTLQLYQMEHQYNAPIKLINQLDILSKFDISNRAELEQRYKTLLQQTDESKATAIISLVQLTAQYKIEPELVEAAIAEIIGGDLETPYTDQLMQRIQQLAVQVDTEAQASTDDLVNKGIQPEFVEQAQSMLAEQGTTPNVENLNIM